MNPRTPYASSASRGVPAPGPNIRSLRGARRRRRDSRGLTLIEMLIGMAITLLMMAAIVNLFANIGSGVRIRRATMEMSGQLRQVRATLFNDLSGATCRTLPWQRPDEDPGYLEIVEGDFTDKTPSSLVQPENLNTANGLNTRTSLVPGSQILVPGGGTDGLALGDYDDVLALTVRNEAAPFKGSYIDPSGTLQTIESNVAEVIWFSVENPADGSLGEPGMRTLYRRVLLVAPWLEPIDLTAVPPSGSIAANDANRFYQRFDISARYDAVTSRWIPNTLSDLAKRENRFAHFFDPTVPNRGYPHGMMLKAIRKNSYSTSPLDDDGPLRPFGSTFENLALNDPDRGGQDVMLNDVLAFDLLVFDPGAPLFEYQGAVVEPTPDNVFALAVQAALAGPPAGALSGFGGFVDLGWDNGSAAGSLIPDYDYTAFANAPQPLFQQERLVGWHPRDPDNNRDAPSVYDTWSFHYENDGINQDPNNDLLIDEGTNGLDDDGVNGVDDIFERETSPPYPVPLRGIQVKLRIYEPDTRQIREAAVTRNFVPQ